MSHPNEPKAADFGRHASHGSLYISSTEEIDRESVLLPYAHYLKQAWEDLGLAGVLCIDGRPTVYLCEGIEFSAEETSKKHQFVWNQGLVPLLILLTPKSVAVHSAVKKPQKFDGSGELFPSEQASHIKKLGAITEALQCAAFVRSIETGQFFQDHASFFPATETVDACLVENLVFTANRLEQLKTPKWTRERSHALLGRVLFIMFLHARGFIKDHHFPKETKSLQDILNVPQLDEATRLLYREFFPLLKKEFNGTMFDEALQEEETLVQRRHLNIIASFLNADDMQGGQMTLDFWAYDFRCIPVETISSIYEEFMKGEDPKKKRKDGAVYTPRHLAETTLHVALEGRYDLSPNWRVLDPACGSAIFLVAMFNLLAAQWLRNNPTKRKATKAKELLGILQDQIRGVEINPAACRIAAFSLYLALFEKLQPMDLDEFKEKVRADRFLPSLVWDAQSEEKPEKPVIIRGDFLKDELPLEKNQDLIIGNPPWEGRGKTQIALEFARRAPAYLSEGGIGCLLLPSTILVNNHGTLDEDFFRSVRVEKMVQLADFRKVLFKAIHPCFILRFANTKPSADDKIIYETPKLNRYDRRRGVIIVEPDDQKIVPWPEVIGAAQAKRVQSLWSRKFWGSPRDESFLQRLDCYPTLIDAKQKMKWGGGVGFKPYYPGASRDEPKKIEPDWSPSDLFLANSNDFPPLVVYDDSLSTLRDCLASSVLEKKVGRGGDTATKSIRAATESVQYKPVASVFTPPMVILSNGFTKFAFCDQKIRFQDSLRSITGKNQDDADLLRFLTVVLGSRLMAYHAFHCGSSNGIGRDKLHLHESLALPFPLPDDDLAPGNAKEIIKEAAYVLKHLKQRGGKLSREERSV